MPLASPLPPRRVNIAHVAQPAARGGNRRRAMPTREQHPRHRQRRDGEQSDTQGTDNHLPVQVSRMFLHGINNSTPSKRVAASPLTSPPVG